MTQEEFRRGLVDLCQAYGYMPDHAYELVDSLVDSIIADPDEMED